jgi:hypothetical protein
VRSRNGRRHCFGLVGFVSFRALVGMVTIWCGRHSPLGPQSRDLGNERIIIARFKLLHYSLNYKKGSPKCYLGKARSGHAQGHGCGHSVYAE